MSEKLKRNPSCVFIAAFLLTSLAYVVFKGEDMYIQVHDFLDSIVVWMKMMNDHNLFLKFHAEVPMIGGLDRCYFWSELKAYVWLHMMFPTFTAVIVSWYLKVIISTAGFIFLGRTVYSNITPPQVMENTYLMSGHSADSCTA